MALVIRKRVSLDFLGDEYKEAYINFRAIPVTQLEAIDAKMPNEGDKDKGKKAIPIMVEILKEYFLSGKSPNEKGELEDVAKEDLDVLDADSAVHCFQGLAGVDPKSKAISESSSTPSTPTESPQSPPQENT